MKQTVIGTVVTKAKCPECNEHYTMEFITQERDNTGLDFPGNDRPFQRRSCMCTMDKSADENNSCNKV